MSSLKVCGGLSVEVEMARMMMDWEERGERDGDVDAFVYFDGFTSISSS